MKTNTVDPEGLGPQLARALALGGLAGVIETVLVVSSGSLSPPAVAFNVGLLVIAFCACAVACDRIRRTLDTRWLATDWVLLLAGVLIFALRGCLRGCGDDALQRLAIPTGIIVFSTAGLLWIPRHQSGAGRRSFLLIVPVAMTLSALDFAARDATLVSGVGLPVLLLVITLSIAGTAVASRGWVHSAAWTLTLCIGCVVWTGRDWSQSGTPLRIRPSTVRSANQPPSGRPSVLLIVMDAVRADHLSLYGYPRRTSVRLDELAQQSVVFDHAVASGNYSLPAHGSLFTGLLPTEHGARPRSGNGHIFRGLRSVDTGLSERVTTLAERLQVQGFATGGLSGNAAYLASWTGLQRGFVAFDDRPRRLMGYHPFSFPLVSRLGLPGPTMQEIEEWDARVVSQGAVEFAGGPTSPFFLFLNYFDAHAPYFEREGYVFEGDRLGSDVHPIPAYDSEIAYVDSAIGLVLDGLVRTGRLDDTIVIVTSDHGDFFGERGGFSGHGKGAYEEILHVPLLVRFPRILPAGRVSRPFGLHEVPRMILDLVQGRSVDWIYTDDKEPRVLSQIWGRVTYADVDHPLSLEPDANVVYQGSRKLIARSSGQDELYDLSTDSREERNLLLGVDPAARVLRETMLRAVTKQAPARAGSLPNLTTGDFERLRGLGYISLRKTKVPED